MGSDDPSATPAADGDAYHWYAEGHARLEAGDARAAADALEQAVALEPGKASLHEALGRAYFAASRVRPAIAAFERALAIDPSNAYAHFALGRCHERQGALDGAAKHYKLAAALSDRADYRTALDRVQRRRDAV